MAYFCAVLARQPQGTWRERDVDPETARKLSELGDLLREHAEGEEPVLLLVEHEDEWFGIVRADGLDDARVFVSDAAAAEQSRIGELLLSDLGEDDEPGEAYFGDPELLEDLGTSADVLLELVEKGALPTDAISQVAEAAGCGELVDELR
ncbi:MAG: tRNA adenosine deaminase-associated protein [Actinomycetales bacterium]